MPIAWGMTSSTKNSSADGLGHEAVDKNNSVDGLEHETVDNNSSADGLRHEQIVVPMAWGMTSPTNVIVHGMCIFHSFGRCGVKALPFSRRVYLQKCSNTSFGEPLLCLLGGPSRWFGA